MKELRRFTLDGVADELQTPSDHEHGGWNHPDAVNEGNRDEQRQRERNQWNADGMAEAIEWMLMATAILDNPLVPRSACEHDAKVCSRGAGRKGVPIAAEDTCQGLAPDPGPSAPARHLTPLGSEPAVVRRRPLSFPRALEPIGA